MKRLFGLLVFLATSAALATYLHKATLTSTSASVSTTVAAGRKIALQCTGGTGRFNFGAGSATAVTTSGLRVLADWPPVAVQMLPSHDTVAMITEDGATSVVCEVLYP